MDQLRPLNPCIPWCRKDGDDPEDHEPVVFNKQRYTETGEKICDCCDLPFDSTMEYHR